MEEEALRARASETHLLFFFVRARRGAGAAGRLRRSRAARLVVVVVDWRRRLSLAPLFQARWLREMLLLLTKLPLMLLQGFHPSSLLKGEIEIQSREHFPFY